MSLWTTIEDDLNSALKAVESFATNFFKAAEPAVVDALAPIATAAVSSLSTELISSSGNLQAFGNAAGKTLQAAAQNAETAGIEATGGALLQAVATAIATLQPSATATVTAVVPVPVPVPTPAPTVAPTPAPTAEPAS